MKRIGQIKSNISNQKINAFDQLVSLSGLVVVISGGTRGIGYEIAKRLAKEKCKIVILGKTQEEDPRLPGTLKGVQEEIEKLGAEILAIKCDIRDEKQIEEAVKKTVEKFGGIDILINNASAIDLSNTSQVTTKKLDLMMSINQRGTFLLTKICLPHLKKSNHSNILNLSPPINLNKNWFKNHVAYTLAKYSMSIYALGWAEEFQNIPISVNCLWPKTIISTAAIQNNFGKENFFQFSRKPSIVAEAAYYILSTKPGKLTGKFLYVNQKG